MKLAALSASSLTMGLCFAALLGCGGAQSTSGDNGKGTASSPDGSGPVDKEAEQAKAFCEHEIEKSALQPPDYLSRKQIMACLTAERPRLARQCYKGIVRDVLVKIIVDKTGKVTGAFPLGDGADSKEAACVAEVVRDVVFPKFKGSNQQVIKKYPFKLGQ